MVALRSRRIVAGVLWAAAASWAVDRAVRAQDAAPPPLQGPIVEEKAPAALAPVDDARAGAEVPEPLARAPKAPPAPLPEEPSDERPDPRAQWVPGHWSWSAAKNKFVWTAGSWRTAPEGATWIQGRWMRDDDGWYRVPGYWNTPKPSTSAGERRIVGNWRVDGPPAEQPDDVPGPAPSPESFYVPGHYTPDGNRLTWTRGFWAEMRPGWDWVPARWIRRPNGWEYREGYWLRETDRDPTRRTVARPVPADRDGLPPAIVDSEPVENGAAATVPEATRPRDPIAEAEASRVMPVPGPYPLPRYRYPYPYGPPAVVIRPPGMYPYGRAGVVLPSGVPPFLPRLLDRVLP